MNAPAQWLDRCDHARRVNGACPDCGRVFGDAALTRAPLSLRERIAEERADLADAVAEFRGVIAGLVDVLAIVMAAACIRDRDATDDAGGLVYALHEEQSLTSRLASRVLTERIPRQRAEARLVRLRALMPALASAAATGTRAEVQAAAGAIAREVGSGG